ncbi:MAG TPA: biliverdin-producing heme oxygenase [Microvirga sp.]|jgi:heme oxygenase
MNLLERLKRDTRPAHDRIERAVNFERSTGSLSAYRALLVRLHGFHTAWEAAVDAAHADHVLLSGRRKAYLLDRDLRALGYTQAEIATLPVCGAPMPVEMQAAVLGSLYVIEGSTLGGAVIAQAVEQRLGLSADTGCAYFRAYGRDVAARWRDFGAVLLAASSPATDDLVIAAADRTFALMQDWLCEAEPLALAG